MGSSSYTECLVPVVKCISCKVLKLLSSVCGSIILSRSLKQKGMRDKKVTLVPDNESPF